MENKEQLPAPRKGTIKFVNVKSGFGFIIDQQTREEFYFKLGDWADQEGAADGVYFFDLAARKRGWQAVQIRRIKE
jgi:CspA family cold shock protein